MSYKEYLDIQAFCKGETDEQNLYIENENETKTIQDIINEAKKHFGEQTSMDDLIFSMTYEQFRCHGYDLYDPSDYGCVFIIHRKSE